MGLTKGRMESGMSIQSNLLLAFFALIVGCEGPSRMPESVASKLSKEWKSVGSAKDGGVKFCTFVKCFDKLCAQNVYRIHVDDIRKICGQADIAYMDGSFYGYFYMLSDCSAYQMGVNCNGKGDVESINLSEVHEMILDENLFDFPADDSVEGFLLKYKNKMHKK